MDGLHLKVVNNSSTMPKPIEFLQKMYAQSVIPFGILDDEYNAVWVNQTMRQTCPEILCSGRFISEITVPKEYIPDYLNADGSFSGRFKTDSVLSSYVMGRIPAAEGTFYYLQAREILDSGTWKQPVGLEQALAAFQYVMRTNLSLISSGLRKEDQPSSAKIERGAANIYRAMLMTEDYARLANGIYSTSTVYVELHSFLSGILECSGRLIEEIGTIFDYHCPRGKYHTATNPVLLTTIVCHLFSNAVRYSDRGSTVFAEVEIGKTELSVTVTNQREAIPMEDMPKLYEPFQCFPPAEIGSFQGYGLGLSIARTGAVFLGGSLNGFSQPGRTAFRLLLPICDYSGRCSLPKPNHELPGYPDCESLIRILLADCLRGVRID